MQADSILVVDDEPQIRRVVRHALAGQGMRVIEAATGSDAIDLAAAELPKMIILDLGLPTSSTISRCTDRSFCFFGLPPNRVVELGTQIEF